MAQKMMDTFKTGQITDLPPFKLPAIAFQRLQNVFSAPEGLRPMHSLCDAVGPTINNVASNVTGFPIFIYKGIGYFVVNDGTGNLAFYKLTNDFLVDRHATTETATKLATAATTDAWSTLTTQEQIAYLLKNKILSYGNNLVYRADISLGPNRELLNYVPYHYWNIVDSSNGVLLDSDGSVNGLAPSPIKFIVHGEYLVAIGGLDGFTHNDTTSSANAAAAATTVDCTDVTSMNVGDYFGIQLDDGTWYWSTIDAIAAPTVTLHAGDSLPSAAASGNLVRTSTALTTENDNYVRWNNPTTIDRWHPSVVVPPDSLAGYKQWMTGVPIADAFLWNNAIFVATFDDLYIFIKVGGETGYTMDQKNISLKIASGAMNSVLATSTAAYVLTLDGLYAFNGLSMNPISAGNTGEFFNKSWFKKNISNSIFTEGGSIQSIQHGMHIPVLDTLLWFVTYGATGQESNLVLMYNYETKSASYLLPPANEIWYPMYGDVQGISVYDKTANTVRCFVFRDKSSSSTPPDGEIDLETGFIYGQNSETSETLNTLLIGSQPKLSNDVFSGLAITINSYKEEDVLHQSVITGKTVGDGYTKGKIDVRASGRFISVRMKGNPNSYADWTQALNQSSSLLNWIGVLTVGGGKRL